MSGLPITKTPHPVVKLPAGDVAWIADDALRRHNPPSGACIGQELDAGDRSVLTRSHEVVFEAESRHSQSSTAREPRYRSDGTMVVIVLLADGVMGISVLLHFG